MLESFEPGQGVKFEVLVDVWPQPRLTGPYTGLTVEAEEEAFEEDLVVKALQEMRKREALAVLSGAETRAAIHPELAGTAEFRAEGAVAVVDLDGYRRNPDGTKGAKVPTPSTLPHALPPCPPLSFPEAPHPARLRRHRDRTDWAMAGWGGCLRACGRGGCSCRTWRWGRTWRW
jgi:hypothetical protein